MQRYNLYPSRFAAVHEQYIARGLSTNRDLYFFRIVKERYSRSTLEVECSALKHRIFSAQRLTLEWNGGGERDRTDDLLLAKQALSQLSYTPD